MSKSNDVFDDEYDELDITYDELSDGEFQYEKSRRRRRLGLSSIYNLYTRTQQWNQMLQGDIALRIQMLINILAGLATALFLLVVLLGIIFALLLEKILIIPVTIVLALIVSPLFFVVMLIKVAPSWKMWRIKIPQNAVWYVEEVDYLHDLEQARITRFIGGTGRYERFKLNERAKPFLDHPTLVLKKIPLGEVLTKEETKVKADVGVVAEFDILAKLTEAEVAEIVMEGPEELYGVLQDALILTARKAIRLHTDLEALEIPEEGNEIGVDLENLDKIGLYISDNLNAYIPSHDPRSKVIQVDLVDYQPDRPAQYEEIIAKYHSYRKALDITFQKMAQGEDLTSVKNLLVAQLAAMEGAGQMKARTQAHKLVEGLVERAGQLQEAARGATTTPPPAASLPEPLSPPQVLIEGGANHSVPPVTERRPERLTPRPSREADDVHFWALGEMPVSFLHIEDDGSIAAGVRDSLEMIFKGKEGYTLVHAGSKNEALKCLKSDLFHVLLCDINLTGEFGDIGGIEVLDDLKIRGWLDHYRVVVFSQEDQETGRMFTDFRESLEHFVSKRDAGKSDKFEKVIRSAVANTGVNFRLEIGADREDKKSFEKYAGWFCDQIQFPPDVKESINLSRERVSKEVETLLRRMYDVNYQTIYLDRVAQDTYQGLARVRRVLQDDKEVTPQIIRIGYLDEIQTESDNFKEHISPTGVRQLTKLEPIHRSTILKGLAYSFPAWVDDLISFKQFYRATPDLNIINEQLSTLMGVFDAWRVGETQRFKDNGLPAYYMASLELDVRQSVPYLLDPAVPIEDETTLMLGELRLAETGNWRIRLPSRPKMIRVHGNLLAKNVLLGTENREQGFATIHLLDFRRTRWGHPLADFVRFESDLKMTVLPNSVDLETFRQLECHHILGDALPDLRKKGGEWVEVDRMVRCVEYLREYAHEFLGRTYAFDMEEYWCGLLFNAFEMAIDTNLPAIARQRARVSAGVLMKKLEEKLTWFER